MKNGAIGCTMSHIQCLITVIREEYDYVFLCEDDIEILNPSLFPENINQFFSWILKGETVVTSNKKKVFIFFLNELTRKTSY